jgi:hypothetical protein
MSVKMMLGCAATAGAAAVAVATACSLLPPLCVQHDPSEA